MSEMTGSRPASGPSRNDGVKFASGASQLHEALAPFLNVDHLIERVALAMAHSEGNRQAQERAHLNNYDALGYTALAKAAVAEVQRLGALAWPTAAATADTADDEGWVLDENGNQYGHCNACGEEASAGSECCADGEVVPHGA